MRIYTETISDELVNIDSYVWCPTSGIVAIDNHSECSEPHRHVYAYVAPGNEL